MVLHFHNYSPAAVEEEQRSMQAKESEGEDDEAGARGRRGDGSEAAEERKNSKWVSLPRDGGYGGSGKTLAEHFC